MVVGCRHPLALYFGVDAMYKEGDQYRGSPLPELTIIWDENGVLRTRGCLVCSGSMEANGERCPRCFDPARYDVPGDAEPRDDGIYCVARIEDVPVRFIEMEKLL